MKNILLVPIQTDAVFLSQDTMVADATADFSNLPYFNGSRDVNADVANISENIVSQPLQTPNLRLRKGLHLHWALPDALNRGRHLDDGRTEFPAVPNRWLVARHRGGVVNSWVVESDYLFPEEKDLMELAKDHPLRTARRESITMPVEIGGRESGDQPFRYMGRKLPAASYDPNATADRYPSLTTVGYGEPSFAAFYPNCHSVFGFHDPEIDKNSGPVSYEIIGWYSDGRQDFFKKLTNRTVTITFEEFRSNLPEELSGEAQRLWMILFENKVLEMLSRNPPNLEKARIAPPAEWGLGNGRRISPQWRPALQVVLAALEQYVRERTGWALPPGLHFADLSPWEGKYPEQTVLYSSLTVDTSGSDGKLPQAEAEGISIVIGNTGTEALSAYLAERLSGQLEGDARSIEEQLEALFLLDKLDHRILDLDAKFDEARHENGFNAVASGHLWTISIESGNNVAADATKEAAKPKLPPEIADLLHQTNALQARYDRSKAELESLGTQLFADWYKYMMSTYPPEDTRIDYPDIDEVRYFIEEQVMGPLRAKEAETGLLVLAKPEEIAAGKNPASGTGGNTGATAKLLARSINELFRKLNEINAALPPGSSFFVLKRVGGPRYYEPKEPVVLLVNEEPGNSILRPTQRHGQDGRQRPDGLLDVHLVLVEDQGQAYLSTPAALEVLRPKAGSLLADGSIGQSNWAGQPWNPFRLDWEVELVPLAEGTNIEERDYAEDVVHQSFKLPLNAPDLVPDAPKIASFQGRNPNIYVGKSLLTPQAKRNLHGRLEAYLREKLPGANLPEFAADLNLTKQKVHELGGAANPVATALLAFVFLQNEHLHLLSQAFSSFNGALVQLRQTLQLPIADPIGFLDYQPLTQEVARLAENSTQLAPQPLTDFNPLRNGKLIVNQLQLVDTFGQVRKIGIGKLDRVLGTGTSPTPTRNADSKIEVPLQPRLAQPARLNFRWLSANEGVVEMNAVPTTSPVCGWVLTNQLDDSLVVYDAGGNLLGSIEAEDGGSGLARWNPAPGALLPVLPEQIENIFLRKMVAKIRGAGAGFVAQFLDGLDASLRSIEPEEFESQQALSLLIGRPVALVRASLNLELQGMPAVDQGWKSFYDDRKDGDFDRKKDGFTKVEFPVRLGKHEQFNDGLVGYWKEEGGELGGHFYLNQLPLENIGHPQIKMLADGEIPISQSIDDAPQIVSMLLDPRGKVHVTTGILPVKDIDIPAEQYLPAMQRMGVTFLTSPLLSPAAKIQSLLPGEEGFQWSWVERQGDGWREVFPFPTIQRGVFLRSFSDKILAQLLQKNWIAPFGQGAFRFLPEEGQQMLDGQFQPADTDLLGILDEISQEQPLEDGSVDLFFFRLQFDEKIMAEDDLGGRLWDRLVRSDVGWCQFIPDRPETFIIKPVAQRSSQDLTGMGMEFLVEEILQTYAQLLGEPRMDAHFSQERMTIREGYLKLKME